MDETYEIIKDSFKDIIQDALRTKLDGHLNRQNIKQANPKFKQGICSREILGKMDLKLSQDRDASFKPKFFYTIKKCFRTRLNWRIRDF